MSHQYKTLGDVVYLWFAANDTSGSADDGASPLAYVRKAGDGANEPAGAPTPVLLTHGDYGPGLYEITITASEGNGYTEGSTYAVFAKLTVDSQNPTGFVGSFSLAPVPSNPIQWKGETIPPPDITGTPRVAVDALLANALTESEIGDLAMNFKALFDSGGDGGDAASFIRTKLQAAGTSLDTLLTRLTAARSGYLDELAAANLPTDVDAILADVTGINGDVMRGTDGANTTTPPTVGEIRNAITGGAYALDTNASGQPKCVDDAGERLATRKTRPRY